LAFLLPPRLRGEGLYTLQRLFALSVSAPAVEDKVSSLVVPAEPFHAISGHMKTTLHRLPPLRNDRRIAQAQAVSATTAAPRIR
jgi:hypothetical protein